MSRQVNYDNSSDLRAGVLYDSHYRLGNEPDRFVKIRAIGSEPLVVHMKDVRFIIKALEEAQELDEQAHADV
jgi:hypothetical protein